MLKLDKITKIYKTATLEVKALDGISLCFRKNEFVSILGPSGCGKTTTLNIVGGLDHYTSGDLIINNVSTKRYKDHDWDIYRNHKIGFIFQAYNLIPHENILENVELALTIGGVKKEERIQRAKAALDKVGLAGMYTKKPNELSGGQCQRVAIARALVNEPDILLADEPTGALDSKTSVQIMDLIKEVSKERLVIMVTHNDEIAAQYSTRIISLKDGQVVGDTNPYSPEDEAREYQAVFEETVSSEDGEETQDTQVIEKKKTAEIEKAKMSWWTAFKLSAKNLWTKLKRTFMTVIASSIGIVGVSAVLAVNYGVRGYLASMQDDMLSGNPISVTENSFDFASLMQNASTMTRTRIVSDSWKDGKIDIQFAMQSLVETSDTLSASMTTNNIDKNYVQFLKDMPKDYCSAVSFRYGLNIKNNLYTHTDADVVDPNVNKNEALYSISGITNICSTILENARDGKYSSYSSMVDNYTNAIGQCLDNEEYVLSQYEVVAGRYPREENEMVIVLNHQNEVTEFVLTLLGFYSQDEFANAIYKFSKDPRFDAALWEKQTSIDVSRMVGKEYMYYPNDSVFHKNNNYDPQASSMLDLSVYQPFTYDYYDQPNQNRQNGMKMKITGVLTPKESVSYGCLSSGLFYTPKFAEKFLKDNMESELSKFIRDYVDNNEDSTSFTSTLVNISSMDIIYGIGYDLKVDFEEDICKSTFLVGSSSGLSGLMGLFGGSSGGSGGGSGTGTGLSIKKTASLRPNAVGASDVPNAIEIYPTDFESKDAVTNYLDQWNGKDEIKLSNGVTLSASDRDEVKYTDSLELIIGMINGVIDIVTIALICFTALSLVVSTVMISIITYVSVMERVKEIGVIRSLGGRKQDVSHLFNAETFMIGVSGGLFGLAVTYILEIILNMTIGRIYNLGMIADLPLLVAFVVLVLATLLTTIAGLIPASSAAKQDPVVALRTE